VTPARAREIIRTAKKRAVNGEHWGHHLDVTDFHELCHIKRMMVELGGVLFTAALVVIAYPMEKGRYAIQNQG
jgi:hypothetical protein